MFVLSIFGALQKTNKNNDLKKRSVSPEKAK